MRLRGKLAARFAATSRTRSVDSAKAAHSSSSGETRPRA